MFTRPRLGGFVRKQLEQVFSRAGFVDIRFAEAATITKPSSRTGTSRNFSIFLFTATRE